MRKAVWVLGSVVSVFAISCSGNVKSPSSYSAIPVSTQSLEGGVGASGAECDGAVPDVVNGPGALAFDRLRMDRQNSSGASILRQYACSGRTYRIQAGETIELWAEAVGATGPRFRVDWGAGEPDSPDATGCGSCLLRHTYRNAGVYQVRVTLDDRLSTSVTRTFTLDSTDPTPTATVSIACTPTAPLVLAPRGESIFVSTTCLGVIGSQFGGVGNLSGSGFNCTSSSGGACGPLTVPLGTVITITATGTNTWDSIIAWQGACAGIGGGLSARTGACTFTVTGNTTLSVVFRSTT